MAHDRLRPRHSGGSLKTDLRQPREEALCSICAQHANQLPPQKDSLFFRWHKVQRLRAVSKGGGWLGQSDERRYRLVIGSRIIVSAWSSLGSAREATKNLGPRWGPSCWPRVHDAPGVQGAPIREGRWLGRWPTSLAPNQSAYSSFSVQPGVVPARAVQRGPLPLSEGDVLRRGRLLRQPGASTKVPATHIGLGCAELTCLGRAGRKPPDAVR